MLEEINSRGLEVFAALLLILGEANIISVTLNKQQGFFTLNVGSDLFDWREPQVASTSMTTTQTSVNPTGPDSALNNVLVKENEEVDMTDSENILILFGIFVITIFLLEDPFVNNPHLTNI